MYQREQNLCWSINQIDLLLCNVINKRSSTFISYAALECRMIIERLEFQIVVLAAKDFLDDDTYKQISDYRGISRANDKYKGLKFRYQSFTEAFAKAVVGDHTIKYFQFRKAEEIQTGLNEYIHIYSRLNDELEFDSQFMQSGIVLLKETIHFLKSNMNLAVIEKSSLKNGFDIEFKHWLNSKDVDIDALTLRLKEIVRQFSE